MIRAMGLVCSRIFAYKIREIWENSIQNVTHYCCFFDWIANDIKMWHFGCGGTHVSDKQTKQSYQPQTRTTHSPNAAIVKYIKKTHTQRQTHISTGEKYCASFVFPYIYNTNTKNTNQSNWYKIFHSATDQIKSANCAVSCTTHTVTAIVMVGERVRMNFHAILFEMRVTIHTLCARNARLTEKEIEKCVAASERETGRERSPYRYASHVYIENIDVAYDDKHFRLRNTIVLVKSSSRRDERLKERERVCVCS